MTPRVTTRTSQQGQGYSDLADGGPRTRRRGATGGKTAIVAVVCGLTLAACGGDDGSAEDGGSSESATPHGYVEGAEEASESQSRLVLAGGDDDAGGTGGDVRVLDPTSEEVTDIDAGNGVRGAVTDGRFGYLSTGDETRVVDSGVWTVDHGDHKHYYRTESKDVGIVEGTVTGAWSDTEVTALAREDGTSVLLDREQLEDGTVSTNETVDGIAVPYEQHVVVAGDDGITVRDRDGGKAGDIDASCASPGDAALTSRGVVVRCDDGAVLVDEDDDSFTGEKMPYAGNGPQGEVGVFNQRPGSTTVAARDGENGALSLDTGDGSWNRIDVDGAVAAVAAVGNDGPVLALTEDGVLHAYDAESGKQTAEEKLLDGDVADGVTITVDTNRAYVNDPASQAVHEVDYDDDLRVARTLDVDIAPARMVETGQ